ncbi:hypothetical protein AMECASPLE_025952 [Ameca splendens]|uniref:Uncharacterized protein n=1 Tax=Ameca splendens TaxID=208324 RepID=A0ABV0YFY9_9TELE
MMACTKLATIVCDVTDANDQLECLTVSSNIQKLRRSLLLSSLLLKFYETSYNEATTQLIPALLSAPFIRPSLPPPFIFFAASAWKKKTSPFFSLKRAKANWILAALPFLRLWFQTGREEGGKDREEG